MEFKDFAPDDCGPKEKLANDFEAYACKLNVPNRCGVNVTSATRQTGKPGFLVETSAGQIEAKRVVVATGPFQNPQIPANARAPQAIAAGFDSRLAIWVTA
jgi:putative flavoprotein involved in K+ transport